MNCDLAFELITDAAGSRSAALARHLDHCPRCRQMRETLAPALGFLQSGEPGAPGRDLEAAPCAKNGARGRQPFVTVEAVRIAQQAATALAAQSETPRQRLHRLAAQALRYLTVLAAGLFLGITYLQPQPSAAPLPRKCPRTQEAVDDLQRATGEMRAVVLSCRACHETPTIRSEDRAASLDANSLRHLEWVASLLSRKTLLAGSAISPGAALLIQYGAASESFTSHDHQDA